jgi:hypothetical protein
MAQPWTPGVQDVADLVPNRTVVQGGATPDLEGTFTANTVPTATQVGRLIMQAEAWVLARTGTVHGSLHDAARAVTAMRAAGLVQTAYPVADASYDYAGGRGAGVDVGQAWFAQADAALEALAAANLALGGGTGSPATAGAWTVRPWNSPVPTIT